MGKLDGKVALVSGAARGQGEAEARRFAAEGAKVVLGDVLEDEVAAVAADIGDAARAVRLDVTDRASWSAAVALASDQFGSVEVLVNNAGTADFTPIADDAAVADAYLRVIQVNQIGVYLGMCAVVDAMTAAGGGSIVNISSIDGLIGMPGIAGYVSSKFAVRGLTKVAALELADRNIRANSVHPGFIDTAMLRLAGDNDFAGSPFASHVPMNRFGTVEEIADLVLFLASDDSSYCTGAEFVIDGGTTAGFALRGPDIPG